MNRRQRSKEGNELYDKVMDKHYPELKKKLYDAKFSYIKIMFKCNVAPRIGYMVNVYKTGKIYESFYNN